jgi:hypothetical protein
LGRGFLLSFEVAVPTAMARRILALLIARDPLSENVRPGKLSMMQAVLAGIATGSLARMRRGAMPADVSRRA